MDETDAERCIPTVNVRYVIRFLFVYFVDNEPQGFTEGRIDGFYRLIAGMEEVCAFKCFEGC